MKSLTSINKWVITAVCIALCIVLPLALHGIPNAGILFSPMHIPVLLCGLVCGWQYGLLCGITAPLLSALITSMPAMVNLPFMMLELAVYGMIIDLVMKSLHNNHKLLNLYTALLVTMLLGRIAAGIARALVFTDGSYSLSVWATAYFVTCLPGIIIQLILIPVLYIALERSGLIPTKEPCL